MKLSKEYNLKVVKPDLSGQWHPTKNGRLTPGEVTPGSHKKVWWICDKGHEWQAIIASRSSGSGCPYCSGKRAGKDNNLSVILPELAGQWHPVKNGKLTPDKVIPGSNKKVWWLCDKGHEWQAIIESRSGSRATGCPYCSNKKVGKDNNLSVLRPDLAGQWHPTKNGSFTPGKVTPGSNKKAWWLCDKGHEWQAIISTRKRGSGCPYCSGKRAGEDNNLSFVRPGLAGQWHPTKNGRLTPDKVTAGCNKKVWWLCDKGHEWQAIITHRRSGSGCPYCSGKRVSKDNNLAVVRPGLAGQWHPTKNVSLTPGKVTPGSSRKAWWLCDKGHEWQAVISNRKRGSGCPYCAGRKVSKENSLETRRPDIAEQWHPTKNGELTPGKVTLASVKKVWWLCDKGHEWQAVIRYRKYGSGCPFCAAEKRKKNRMGKIRDSRS